MMPLVNKSTLYQKHLQALADDFQRFEKRMDKLSKHINLAHQDVSEVNTSAKKLRRVFKKLSPWISS